MKIVAKWGFGAAPIKEKEAYKNTVALAQLRRFLNGEELIGNVTIEEHISRVKGMFNRIIRQDQWDWFTVNMLFDYPSNKEVGRIVELLTELRKAIISAETEWKADIIRNLKQTNLEKYILNYMTFDNVSHDEEEYIYILSRREEKELLKIGMTTRNVIKRCQEINSSTGVVYPLSPRKAYRVNNAKEAEKLVHEALEEYRIRSDREFFLLEYTKACQIIESILNENELMFYRY